MFEKIIKIYPELTIEDFSPRGTITLQNDSDGKGDYIKEWNHSLPRPTDEQLGIAPVVAEVPAETPVEIPAEVETPPTEGV